MQLSRNVVKLFLIAMLAVFRATVAEDVYGPYQVYIGSVDNTLTIKTTNNSSSAEKIESITVSEKSKPAFVTGLSLPSPVSIMPGDPPADMRIKFDISQDYKTYVGQTGNLKLQWQAANDDCMVDWPDKNAKPWDITVKLEVKDLFTAICTPPSQTIKDGETKNHTIVVTNLHTTEDVNFTISVSGGGAGWSVSGGNWSGSISAGANHSETFSVTNSGAASDLLLTVQVRATDYGISKSPENLDNAENPGHVTDHPDDNFSVTSSEYPTDWLYDSKSSIGVLSSGWGEGLNYLLGKYNVATTVVKQDLTILNEPGKTIDDLDVLLIGSAGLAGLESSPTFRQKLSDYVEHGGSLIAFTAKNGYEFQALPGGLVAGYGWDEDQSCLNNAVSIIQYHQILSGQTSTNITANFDGYFTKWPDNAKILLQRNKNGMPALLAYSFGQGTVIAMTCFPDWAYGHNQSKKSDQILVRDAVAWARQAKTLPEFSINTPIEFIFDVVNQCGVESGNVKLTVRNPDRVVVHEQTVAWSQLHNDTLPYNFSYGPAPNNVGIWSVGYTLLDAAGNVIQEEILGEQFVVSDPAEVAGVKDITFGVNSDAEYYANGSEGVFSIHLWNHTSEIKNVTVWWSFPHNYWAKHDPIYGSPGTTSPGNKSNLKKTLEIPAHGEAVHTYTVPIYSYDRLWADFYDENGTYLGKASRGFHSYNPSCNVIASTEKYEYKGADTVSLNVILKNRQKQSYTTAVNVTVLNPENAKVWEGIYSQTLAEYGTSEKDTFFTMPVNPLSGVYRIRVEATTNGNRAGSDYVHCIVPEAYLALTPILPGTIVYGDNPVSIEIENCGVVAVTDATLDVALVDPNAETVWNGTTQFSIDESGYGTVDFVMHVPDIIFGDYQFNYQAHYNGLSSKIASMTLPSSCMISAQTDKSDYRIREQIALTVNVVNTGRFDVPYSSVAITIPGIDSVADSVSLAPNQNIHLPILMQIPETMTAGCHQGTVTLSLPSSSSRSSTFSITIPRPEITLSLGDSIYHCGDLIEIAIANSGGTDAAVEHEIHLFDNSNVSVLNHHGNINLLAGEHGAITGTIPDNALNGSYRIELIAVEQSTTDTTKLTKTIDISGLTGSLHVQTDKQIYREAETKTALADITLTQGSIIDGKCNLKVFHILNNTKIWTTQADWETGERHQVDITTYPGDVIIAKDTADGDMGDRGAGDTPVLIVKDVNAWNQVANETVLQEKGIGYNVITTDSLSSWDFRAHGTRIILIESDQYTYSYQNLLANREKIAGFVSDGGVLIAHSCDGGWHNGVGGQYRPGTEKSVPNSDNTLEIVDPQHPLLNGISDEELDGFGSSTHGYFTDLMQGTNVIVADDGKPVYIEYTYGHGTVLATMQTMEWQHNRGCRILENEIDYSLTLLKNRHITLTYDAQTIVEWNTINWTSDEPESTAILVSVRTADSLQGLASAPWSENYSAPGTILNIKPGRWIQIKASLETANPATITPVLHDIAIGYAERINVWENDIALVVDDSMSFSNTIVPLQGSGKFILQGTVTNYLDQKVGRNEYSFYVGDDLIVLAFDTDKKVYKPGETVTVNGTVYNNSTVDMANVEYGFSASDTVLYSNIIDLPKESAHPFTFSFSAPDALFTLVGTIEDRKIIEQIQVEAPVLNISVESPDIVGRSPFDISVLLENTGNVDADIDLSIDGSTQSIMIPAKQIKVVTSRQSITEDAIVNIIISGDVTQTLQKNIQFGEAAAVAVSADELYPEGLVSIPYTVSNTGVLDTKFDITFTCGEHTVTRPLFIPVGESVQGDLSYNLTEGDYTVTYSSYFTHGSQDFKVAKADEIALDLDVSRYSPPSVLILRDYYSETGIRNVLTEAGMEVTVTSIPYSSWNGTNPSPDDFDVIIMPAADYYYNDMPQTGQQALVDFVTRGGGFITTEWITYGVQSYGYYATLDQILLYEPSQWAYRNGNQTLTIAGAHPITAGLPSSFSIPYHYANKGGIKNGVTQVVSGTMTPTAVAAKQHENGRIVQYSLQGNYLASIAQSDTNMKLLLINAVNWAAKSFENNNVRAELIVSNNGYNDFDGTINSSTQFFTSVHDLMLSAGTSKTYSYDLDISTIEAGTYAFTSKALCGGKVLQQTTQDFVIGGPVFELNKYPESMAYAPGQEITMSFGIKNTGMVEAEADIRLVVADIVDDHRLSWIAPGIEKEENWTFQIPDDFPEGDYKAEFRLQDTLIEIPFSISGVKLTVAAHLDKPLYSLGDTAVLTLDITNHSSLFPEVYALTASNGDNDRKDFTLSDQNTVQLHLPINESTANRIAYGVYLSSGRALYLNTLFVRIIKGPITLYTDKSVYQTGESVTVHVATQQTGDLSVTTSTGFQDIFNIQGDYSFTFTLPAELASGTQSISYSLGEYSGICYFDVIGYSLKVMEMTLDKQTYDPIDTMMIDFTVQSNTDIQTVIKGWLYDPSGSYTDMFEVTRDLVNGDNRVSVHTNIAATVDGVHKVVYGIYKAGVTLTLVTGAEAFDVRQAAILSVATDKDIYGETEPVTVNLSAFACSEYEGRIDLLSQGNVMAGLDVLFTGDTHFTIDVEPLPPAEYTLIARLHKNNDVMSEKSASFLVRDMSAPSSPTGLSLAMDGRTATMSWVPNKDPDLQGYNIYANEIKDNAAPVRTNRYRKEALVSGYTYTFYVTAIDRAGNESTPSALISTALDNKAPVITISPASSVVADTPVTLTYSVTDDTDKNPLITANYVSPTTFTIDGTYAVAVSAEDAQGNKAAKTVEITIETGAPAPVEVLIAQDAESGGTVNLVWDTYAAPNDVAEYRIFVSSTEFNDISEMAPHVVVSSENGTHDISDLINNERYFFGVVAVDTRGNFEPNVTCATAIPTRGTGSIAVTSMPEGARVHLGGNYGYLGEFKGTTPLTISDMKEGCYVLQIVLPGYTKHYELVTVTAHQTTTVAVNLTKMLPFVLLDGKNIQADGGYLDAGDNAAGFIIDWDMDGKKDILCANAAGDLVLYTNSGTDALPEYSTPSTLLVSGLGVDAAVFVVDWDNDSHKDILVGTQGAHLVLYRNVGTNTKPVFAEPVPIGAMPLGNTPVPFVIDWNCDYNKDLVIGTEDGTIALFLNIGSDTAPAFNNEPDEIIASLGSGNAAAYVVGDWDRDGDKDIITGNAAGSVLLYTNSGTDCEPIFGNAAIVQANHEEIDAGTYSKPFAVDYNSDGVIDLVVGNGEGGLVLYTGRENQPPVVDAGVNMRISSEDLAVTTVSGSGSDPDSQDVLTYRWVTGETVLLDWNPVVAQGECPLALSITGLSLGEHALMLEVTDSYSIAADTMILVIENSAPRVVPSGAGVYEIFTDITLGGEAVDFDGDVLDYQWLLDGEVLYQGEIKSNEGGDPVVLPSHTYPAMALGDYTFVLRVSDGINEPVEKTALVTVVDTTKPTVAPVANHYILWPPNHRMVDIEIDVHAGDNSGIYTITADVTCDEPDDINGAGNHSPDWAHMQIVQENGGFITLQLRSERAGNGDGRQYTITISVTDQSENVTTTSVNIIVPHDME